MLSARDTEVRRQQSLLADEAPDLVYTRDIFFRQFRVALRGVFGGGIRRVLKVFLSDVI